MNFDVYYFWFKFIFDWLFIYLTIGFYFIIYLIITFFAGALKDFYIDGFIEGLASIGFKFICLLDIIYSLSSSSYNSIICLTAPLPDN